jgi:hypothetical protein
MAKTGVIKCLGKKPAESTPLLANVRLGREQLAMKNALAYSIKV